jgi:hypothetical protein
MPSHTGLSRHWPICKTLDIFHVSACSYLALLILALLKSLCFYTSSYVHTISGNSLFSVTHSCNVYGREHFREHKALTPDSVYPATGCDEEAFLVHIQVPGRGHSVWLGICAAQRGHFVSNFSQTEGSYFANFP